MSSTTVEQAKNCCASSKQKEDHTGNDAYYKWAIAGSIGLSLIAGFGLAFSTENSPKYMPINEAVPYHTACSNHSGCAALSGECCPDLNGKFKDCCDAIDSSLKRGWHEAGPDQRNDENWREGHFFGIGYYPVPYKEEFMATFDYMTDYMEPFWGKEPSGKSRNDLATIKALGFKTVMMYGHFSFFDSTAFLDYAEKLGLRVIVSLGNIIYQYCRDGNQIKPYDCFNVTHSVFSQNLYNGWSKVRTDGNRNYHSAIKAIVLMNEPEFLITNGGSSTQHSRGQGFYTKSLLSAFDAVLDAEVNMRIVPDRKGKLPPFSATFSSDKCEGEPNRPGYRCISSSRENTVAVDQRSKNVGDVKTVPFMYDFVIGALRPSLFGYKTRCDGCRGGSEPLKYGMQNRFVFSYNTEDTAQNTCSDVLQYLDSSPIRQIPRFLAGFGNGSWSLPEFKKHLDEMRSKTKGISQCGETNGPAVAGMILKSFIKQSRTDKFGLYALGRRKIGESIPGPPEQMKQERDNMTGKLLYEPYQVWCIRGRFEKNTTETPMHSFPYQVKLIFDEGNVSGALPNERSCPKDRRREVKAEDEIAM